MNFEDIISLYMEEKININIFHKLIKEKFNRLLIKDKFKELNYLKIYPFISELQDEDLYVEEILKRKISVIQDILGGIKNYSYDMWIGLETEGVEDYYRMWSKYKKGEGISSRDLEKINNAIENITLKCNTVSDICMTKLLRLMQGLPEAGSNEPEYNLLYTGQPEQYYVVDEIEKLINILRVQRSVHILLIYTTQFSCVCL